MKAALNLIAPGTCLMIVAPGDRPTAHDSPNNACSDRHAGLLVAACLMVHLTWRLA